MYKEPRLLEHLKVKPIRKLTDEQIAEMKRFRASHTRAETAKYFKIGHSTVDRYTVDGYKEKERVWNDEWQKRNPEKVKIYNSKTHKRIYRLKKTMMKEEMDKAIKVNNERIKTKFGKDYFYKKHLEFLERNPDYFKKRKL